MHRKRLFIATVLIGVVAAACGGGSPTAAPGGATQNPAATTDGGGGGGPTDAPEATQSGGGGGGNVDTTYGRMHIEISGPVTKSADYGFLPAGSIFGGAQGSALNFSTGVEGTSEIASILIGADGKVVVSWITTDFQAPAAECTTSNWNVGGTSGSGSFDCTAALVIMGSGAMVQDAKVKGNFEAHS
jgi:hypothetical protein